MEELVDVIAVLPGQRPGFIREHRMPIPEEIFLYCTSLVTRVRNGPGSSTWIHLAHFSVQEYLTSDRLPEGMAKPLEERSAKASVVKVCLSYLLSVDCGSNEAFPFAEFAARIWPLHAAETSLRDDAIHKLIVELLQSDLLITSHFLYCSDISSHCADSSIGCAAFFGLTRVVRDLLDGNGRLSYTNEEFYEALCYSSRYGHGDTAQYLFDKGTKLSTHEFGQYALSQASKFGHKSIMRLLLANGADINAVDFEERTALHYAANSGHVDTISILLSEGANIDAANSSQETALHYAAQYNHVDIVSALLSDGANTEAANSDQETALHYAAGCGHVDVVSILLSEGANIEAANSSRKTALHYAAENGHTETVSMLLSKSANHSIVDNYGGTALQYAAERNHLSVVKILVSQGASLDAVDSD